jgi:hypothetical protein
MQMHVVTDSMDNYYGPYADKALAERVLKIVQMAADESAEILSENVDPFSTEIMSGLLPYSVEIMVYEGRVTETKVALTWPPKEHQGIVQCTDFYREYFFWAKTKAEALTAVARVKIDQSQITKTESPLEMELEA